MIVRISQITVDRYTCSGEYGWPVVAYVSPFRRDTDIAGSEEGRHSSNFGAVARHGSAASQSSDSDMQSLQRQPFLVTLRPNGVRSSHKPDTHA